MGSTFIGVHKYLAESYRKQYRLTCFVETGTLRGESAIWASKYFEDVLTVEINESLFTTNKERFIGYDNIRPHFGNSRFVIKDMIAEVTAPALFWLDAHADSDNVVQESGGRCAVMEEIENINQLYKISPHVVMVDDARLFTGNDGWPTLEQVRSLLAAGGRSILVVDDVVVAVKE